MNHTLPNSNNRLSELNSLRCRYFAKSKLHLFTYKELKNVADINSTQEVSEEVVCQKSPTFWKWGFYIFFLPLPGNEAVSKCHFLLNKNMIMIMICFSEKCSPLIVLLIDQPWLLQEVFLHICSKKKYDKKVNFKLWILQGNENHLSLVPYPLTVPLSW